MRAFRRYSFSRRSRASGRDSFPSNEAKTRANAWAYATIPSVQEVLILSSTAVRAEILRQGDETPEIVVGTETLRLASVGYAGPLAEFYVTTYLT